MTNNGFPLFSQRGFLFLALLLSSFPTYADDIESANQHWTELGSHVAIPFHISTPAEQVYALDINGDERTDFLIEHADKIEIQIQSAEDPAFRPPITIPLASENTAWDLCNDHEAPNSRSLTVLTNGERIESWRIADEKASEPTVALSGLDVYAPESNQRMSLCRDINNDGMDDLVLPKSSSLVMYLREPDGSFKELMQVESQRDVNTNIHAEDLNGRVGQSISTPPLVLRDVNGDGLNDLVVQTRRKLEISLADPDSARYFPAEPTISRDFSEFVDRIDQMTIDDIDYGDLFAAVSENIHLVNLKDVDNDQHEDLVLQVGTKIIYYRGENDGIADQPTQVLKLSGNVFYTALADFDEDGTQELISFQAPKVSLGRMLLLLAVPQAFKLRVLIFEQQDGLFTRRPAHAIDVSIRVPNVISIMRKAEKLEELDDPVDGREIAPMLLTQLDDFAKREVLLISDGELRLYWNALAAKHQIDEETLIDRLKSLPKHIEIDVGDLMDSIANAVSPIDSLGEQKPVLLHRFDTEPEFQDLLAMDINGDGLDDFFVFENRTADTVSGVLLVSQ